MAARILRRSRSSRRGCNILIAIIATKRRINACVKRSAGTTRPLYYLAIPPSLFADVAQGLAQAGCTKDARVVVEKTIWPRSRFRASAQPHAA